MMKNLILISILVSISKLSLSQTFIAPSIGIDLARMENFDSISANESNLSLLEKGFSILSPTMGIRIKQLLPNNFFLFITSYFTHKYVKATNFSGIVQPKGISYNYFRNNVSLNYRINKYYFGGGVNYNILKKISYVYRTDSKDEFINKVTEAGIQFSIGMIINKFDFEVYYYNGLSEIHDKYNSLHTKPISSIGLMISYNLKIID